MTDNTTTKPATTDEIDREELLDRLWSAVAKGLLAQLEHGEPTAATFSAASRFLAESGYNGLSRPSPARRKEMDELAKRLPFQNPEDDSERTRPEARPLSPELVDRLPFKGESRDTWGTVSEGKHRLPFA